MSRPRPKNPKPTWTHLVLEALRVADDFMTSTQLVAATGGNFNQVSAALHSLQHYKAVDAVVAQDQTFWFLTGDDTRIRHLEERTPEEPGSRKPRRNSKINQEQK